MNEDQRNQEQHNDFTEKKSLGSRKGMIALLFILIVLMLYGFLHSALKSDKKEDSNEPQTKVVRDIKSETNKADYGEQNKRLQKEHKELQYQKVETPTVDPVAAEEAKAAAAAAANAAKEAQAAAAKAAAAEEAAASSAIKFNINSNSNNDKPANQGKSGYIQVIQ
jgi:outer membrane biosynthesis protein TonB